MRILVVNAGSSSLKLSVVDGDEVVAEHQVQDWDGQETGAIRHIVSAAGGVDAVGHRVVHGGRDLLGPTMLDRSSEVAIEALTPLAPLHQPRSLAGIRAGREVAPDLPTVACFDTAFHATLPPVASTYAVPAAWRRDFGVRRYGFHGLSHAWASRRAAEMLTFVELPAADQRVVVAHLGAGASLCAVAGGRSVNTTMGFTPLEGLVMATRSGSVDPGMILWLQQHHGLTAADVEDALEHRSGLLGLSGSSGDLREVQLAADGGDAAARLAIDVYVHHLCAGIAAMVASLGGLDVLVFTGGVGEHSAPMRSAAALGLGFLGVAVDDRANEAAGAADADVAIDVDITAAPPVVATVRTLVICAREDLQIATEVRALLGA